MSLVSFNKSNVVIVVMLMLTVGIFFSQLSHARIITGIEINPICVNNCIADRSYCYNHCNSHEFNCHIYRERYRGYFLHERCDFDRGYCIEVCNDHHRYCHDNCTGEILEVR